MNDEFKRIPKVNWKADWIWCEGEADPYHFFLFVRRTFEIADKPCSAALHITASDRYRLFVNGRYLGRGPARCDPRHQSYDTYDIEEFLHTGVNTIAVQAYHYGCATGYTRDSRAGLLAQVELMFQDGSSAVIGTDSSWRVRPAEGWRRDAKLANVGIGVNEIYNANLDPSDWMMPGFNDQGWKFASVIRWGSGAWSRPEPRDIPMLSETEVFPLKVERIGEVLEFDEELITGVNIPEMLAREVHEPLQYARIDNVDAILSGDASAATAYTSRQTTDDIGVGFRDPFILLDFGREINGFVRIRLEGPAQGIVDFTYGEQLIGGRIVPIITGVRHGDRYIMREGLQTWETFEYKSPRYMQITFRNLTAPVKIYSVSINSYSYPAEVKGYFESSDAVLNKLWKACAATMPLCMDDGFMDAAVKEKRNWLGDGSHALLGTYAVYGNIGIVKRYFHLVSQGGLGDGMLRPFYPGSDLGFIIPQHALVWAVRVWEHYEYFKDRKLLAEMYPILKELAGWCSRHNNDEGLLENLPYWNWLGWTSSDLRGANFSTNAFYLKMLEDMDNIAKALGYVEEASDWGREAVRVRIALKKHFWNAQRGLFEDSLHKGRLTGVFSELANGLAMLYDIADAEQCSSIADNLSKTGSGIAPVTTLLFHYVPQGLAKAGCSELALEFIRREYSYMLNQADTIWESTYPYVLLKGATDESDPAFDDSNQDHGTQNAKKMMREYQRNDVWKGYVPASFARAHCGGVSVAFVLLTDILGIKPKGPGFDRCIIQPCINLLESARGVLPSARGEISVSWERSGEQTVLDISLPEGMEADLYLPVDEYRGHVLICDGKSVQIDQVIKLTDGKHKIELVPAGLS